MLAKQSLARASCLSMVQADRPNSLDCGTLYGAEFIQLNDVSGGNFSIEWVDMGHACQEDLLGHLENTTFFDIFDWQPYDNTSAAGCPQNMLSVNTGAGSLPSQLLLSAGRPGVQNWSTCILRLPVSAAPDGNLHGGFHL